MHLCFSQGQNNFSYNVALFIVAASHSCYIHGDPHFNTTDGDTYRFTGDVPCEYVLVDHRHFKVFGTFVACKTSCLNKVRIVFFSWTYILGPNDTVTAGATGKAPSISSIADLPYIRHVFQVEKADNGISVTFNIGVSVYWDKNKSATINFVDRWMNEATMFGKYT